MSKRLFVDIHILQTVPPSNLNRDDAGTPKHCTYGGVRRARVSSQAWKRATRLAFVDQLPAADLGVRTKRVSGMLTEELLQRTTLDREQATRLAVAVLRPLGIKEGKRSEDTAYLLYFGRNQLAAIARLVAGRAGELAGLSDSRLRSAVEKLPVGAELSRAHPVDVGLFGRMVADIPALNVDAATQVAHALSTHPVDPEFDYYTAVDDEVPEHATGAGMIGTVEFNSATLYRHATIGVHQLRDNLADPAATASAVDLFLDAFTRSVPSGHRSSFAHHTVPHLVLVALRTDRPVNLVSAYERPVLPERGGIAGESLARLVDEFTTVATVWDAPAALTAATYGSVDDDGAPAYDGGPVYDGGAGAAVGPRWRGADDASNTPAVDTSGFAEGTLHSHSGVVNHARGMRDQLVRAFGPSLPFRQLRERVTAATSSWLDGGEVRVPTDGEVR